MEWPLAGNHFVEHQPQRIDITGRSQRLAHDLLRRHVRRRAHNHACGDCASVILGGGHSPRNAKIGDDGAHLLA